MGFEVHKLKTETLGEYLSSVRFFWNLTTEQVADRCGVSAKLLENLETGNFNQMPEQVYVLGFLRKLARLYKINEIDIVRQFKKEAGFHQTPTNDSPKIWRKLVGWAWLPGRWWISFGLGAFLLVVGVVGYQVAAIAMVPDLEIYSPIEGQNLDGGVVSVAGRATPGSEIVINNQQIFAGEDGDFSVSLGVLSGIQTLNVKAKNRFGKESARVVNFSVNGNFDQKAYGPAHPSVVLGVKIDSGVEAGVTLKGVFRPVEPAAGGFSFYTSGSTILLSTMDAGKTRVVLNGQDMGYLGKPGEELNNIPFTAGPQVGLLEQKLSSK